MIGAAGATVGTGVALAAYAGFPRVGHLISTRHSWLWLAACFCSELIAYGGYVLTIRDMARVDRGPELDLAVSVQTVVAGFGVFAATRASGGFAVDYWAFRRAGAPRREAWARVLGLGFLEYVVLSIAAVVASTALLLNLDGRAGWAATLPSLTVIPAFVIAAWATSPKRVARLSRERKGFRRILADSVAGANYVRQLLLSPREHGLGVAGNVLYWAGDICCLWSALALCGVELSLSKLVLAYTGGYVLTRRALPAGGAGLVEVALTFGIVAVGGHLVPTLVAVVIYRLFNFWLPIVPALVLMPAVRDLRERFRDVDREAGRSA